MYAPLIDLEFTNMMTLGQAKVDIPDIMSTLLGALQGSKPTPEELHMLRGDSQLIVVAGR